MNRTQEAEGSNPSSSTNSKRDFPPHPAADLRHKDRRTARGLANALWRASIILAEKRAATKPGTTPSARSAPEWLERAVSSKFLSARIPPKAGRERRHAFTLVELMITVIIVALLASFTIPSLLQTIERSRVEEVQEILLALYQAERYYFLDYTVPAGGGQYGTLRQLVKNNYITDPDPITNPNTTWEFDIRLTKKAALFNISARRVGTTGLYSKQTVAIDNNFTGDPNPLYGGKVFTIRAGTTGHLLRD